MLNKFKILGSIIIQKVISDYWIELITESPYCIYYFGPFQTFIEAKAACPGYIDDLESEGVLGIKVVIKRCRPDALTICDEEVSYSK
ncbi:DUF1816 domain-containing protein [Nostoc sp. XA010]|uniref:DUF1816 domain-containing protein n=1 Tax=Nostoc sp. XA010 TaxID=2780407 RepID=UPI001E41E7EE|nr:DUF1816 domain-containing protein [Nostoc sp. XA010]MCC5656010.1 DUF1816 domain-containing protein [Nostoc sp. XA010]